MKTRTSWKVEQPGLPRARSFQFEDAVAQALQFLLFPKNSQPVTVTRPDGSQVTFTRSDVFGDAK